MRLATLDRAVGAAAGNIRHRTLSAASDQCVEMADRPDRRGGQECCDTTGKGPRADSFQLVRLVAAPPTMVTLAFSDALGPSSEIKVVRTVTVLPTGEELATGGTPVAEASGTAALSADGRALRVRLPDGSPGGLYYVRWTAVRAGSRVERFGDLYFGVGMAVPEHIVSSGVLDEHDPDAFDRPARIVGSALLIALGFALPFLIELGRGASTGRG